MIYAFFYALMWKIDAVIIMVDAFIIISDAIVIMNDAFMIIIDAVIIIITASIIMIDVIVIIITAAARQGCSVAELALALDEH